MKTIKPMKTFLAVLLTGLFAVHAYGGNKDDKYEVQEPSQLLVQVEGVVCSFCAYGTEKNLARLEFVNPKFFGGDGVLLNLKKAFIALALQENKKIDLGNIVKAIQKGGYVPIAIHLKLVGRVVKQDGDPFIENQWNGQRFRLLDAEGQPWTEESDLGQNVIIQGLIPVSALKKQSEKEPPAVRIKQLKRKD
ncbi:hypothetical protein HYR99_25105 [Candidatus Poribacteria bacterium]|nr:hypothetical protein [Candidatus Poribacteria bacterium]